MTPYVGCILPFAGSFAPDGWHLCDGSLLPINQYQMLFAVLGTRYGGNGTTTFGIPNLSGRMPVGAYMNASGGDYYALASMGGQAGTTVTSANMPLHTHTAPFTAQAAGTYQVSNATNNTYVPTGNLLGTGTATSAVKFAPYSTAAATVPLASSAVNFSVPVGTTASGPQQVVPSVPPYVTISFIIALLGLFPSQP